MRSLIVFLRIIIVGILWGIVFTEGIRVIMLCNWHFDIFWPDHWRQAYELWKAGWTVHAPKEWAFVIILLTFFPMLITGWWTLSLVNWEHLIYQIITSPLALYRRFIKGPINVITTHNKYGVTKRKSYKQIRPAGVVSGYRSPISDYGDSTSFTSPAAALLPSSVASSNPTPKTPKTDVSATIDHALFKFDDDDDDFDLDIDSFEKTNFTKGRDGKPSRRDNKSDSSRSAPRFDFDDDEEETPRNNNRRNDKNNRRDRRDDKFNKSDTNNENITNKSRGPVYDAIEQKGYQYITNITAKNITIDIVAVSENKISLCLIDKESGDWLADEELFNGEEPLWFSENSHRISPVRKLCIARDLIKEQLSNTGLNLDISSYVIIQMANIINADDMFEIWNSLGIKVTRINRGTPKEIPLFSKTLEDPSAPMPKKEFDKLQKVLKTIK